MTKERRSGRRILVTGAGSAQSNATVNCLLSGANASDEVIGSGSDPVDLMFSRAARRYLVPHATSADYKEAFLRLLDLEQPDMIHFQHDLEVWTASSFRDEITARGVRMLLPAHETIDTCVHKWKTWQLLSKADLKVPNTFVLNEPQDLARALRELGKSDGKVWLRSSSIGNGGKGALATSEYDEARSWVDRHSGWGSFLASEVLPGKTVTWLSIWVDGELVAAQGRLRHSWAYGSIAVSGVSGITKICETVSDPQVDEVAMRSVFAVDPIPNGVFGVDMMYDADGIPNPTEINIARFFTTIEFFCKAGLNMPQILTDIVLSDQLHEDVLPRIPEVNPLPSGLLWIRAIDERPILTSRSEIDESSIDLTSR